MNTAKPKVLKDYKKLDNDTLERIKLAYPYGFSDNLISFTNKDGQLISALPFETEDRYYLIKMSIYEAELIIEEDEDYDDEGYLHSDVKNDYQDKHGDFDSIKESTVDE